MFGKSIYKKLTEDFSFVNNYSFHYLYDGRHYIQPSVVFEGNPYRIVVGFNYEERRFFVILIDSTKKRYPAKETLDRISILAFQGLDSFKGGISQHEDLLEGISLIGKTYKEQVDQVKEILLKYLQKIKQ